MDEMEEGGSFVAKVLAGGAEASLQTRLKTRFATVSNVKPPASRADSAEKYVVARGFRGGGSGAARREAESDGPGRAD